MKVTVTETVVETFEIEVPDYLHGEDAFNEYCEEVRVHYEGDRAYEVTSVDFNRVKEGLTVPSREVHTQRLVSATDRPMISVIAAVAQNGVIGDQQTIPWKCPEDMARFKKLTTGGIVIMGRKTFESMSRCPLPGRINIVVTSKINPREHSLQTGYHVANSVQDSLDLALELRAQGKTYGNIWIIGGAGIYKEVIENQWATSLEITRIMAEPKGDVFMPSFEGYELGFDQGRETSSKGVEYHFESWFRL